MYLLSKMGGKKNLVPWNHNLVIENCYPPKNSWKIPSIQQVRMSLSTKPVTKPKPTKKILPRKRTAKVPEKNDGWKNDPFVLKWSLFSEDMFFNIRQAWHHNMVPQTCPKSAEMVCSTTRVVLVNVFLALRTIGNII